MSQSSTAALRDWDARSLAHARSVAQAAWPGLQLQWLPSIDSTNSELMRRAAQGQHAPCVLVAGQQTAGRGRMGKRWHTPQDGAQASAALTFSLGLPLAPRDWSGLSLAVGIAVVSALSDWARQHGAPPAPHPPQPRLGLKWPNDVWLLDAAGQGRKMAGILIETAAQAGAAPPGARYAVIGIGLNLQAPPVPEAAVPPVGVAQWLPGLGPIAHGPALLCQLLPALLAAVQQFNQQGFGAFWQAFGAWDLLAGRQVALSDGRSGACLGVSATGELLLDCQGQVLEVGSGEVSVRPVPAQAPALSAAPVPNPIATTAPPCAGR
ncbi:biotin--[acetyl-CoA-carboxylase] ligase [Vandammella animalimorsus]|uniref:Biotin--[acetyl-CoA-carboxylase] ligase n=1 Tax=Vandammella animalimorsus TaxID=2029117 RepID=A0A2A2AGH9_9BURK|nr:biotin--[acetyl-CoA-carboxylase] ligase [Vandammella animalimorsus]PAT36864.1 biotin--[acetyl-CoA-carboxylase] ligase [Vandammella animalimorsus]